MGRDGGEKIRRGRYEKREEIIVCIFFLQAEDDIEVRSPSGGHGDVYKRKTVNHAGEMNAQNGIAGSGMG